MAGRPALIVCVLLLLLPVPSSSHLLFKLQGNVHPDGYLYVTMKIGEPAREYHLDVDSGSILTWVQCHIPNIRGTTWPQQHPLYELKLNKLVPSTDPLCVELIQHPGHHKDKTCSYNIGYVAGSSHGYLIRDQFTLPTTRNGQQTIAFGCGYNQPDQHFDPGKKLPVDGILGIGRGNSPVELISQLMKRNVITKDVIGHCISSKGEGFLFLGDYKYSSGDVTWARMNQNEKKGHYSPEVLADLYFKGKVISKKPMKVVFDSGATYTFFDAQPYQETKHAVIASLDKSLTVVKDPDMELCWKGPKSFQSMDEVKPLFKSIFLVFHLDKDNKKATLDIPPENYLIIKDGNVCFGILRHAPLGEKNIIGAITMQDRIVIYDNENGQLGWVHDSCETKSDSVITSRL
ncbi:hypothetical protein ACP70R_022634 [Stipagrostis hirtigluma subsp. patula]